MNRRSFISLGAATTAVAVIPQLRAAPAGHALHIASNTYPWAQFAKRDGTTFVLHTDETLEAIARTGITGYEPNMTASDFAGLPARLKRHGLEMRSLYVNSALHDPAQAEASIAEVLAVARRAVETGTRIIVTNPSPIRWGGPENKTDEQLRFQARSLDSLGEQLRRMGLTLAYHNHDIELRVGAREYHHMLTGTNPENVKFCLDAHWVYRGCGDSEVALFDTLELYGHRVVELHLRQSRGGVWTEVFSAEGDINYRRLAKWFADRNLRPHLVLEQAVEEKSPKTMNVIAAHRQGLINAQDIFAAWR